MWGKIICILFIQTGATFAQDTTTHQADSTKHHSIKYKMTVTEVLAKYTDRWIEIPGVVGTAEGKKDGKPCINIMVEKTTPEIRKRIPRSVEGFAVVIEQTGKIDAR
jgi:hypothetical protein